MPLPVLALIMALAFGEVSGVGALAPGVGRLRTQQLLASLLGFAVLTALAGGVLARAEKRLGPVLSRHLVGWLSRAGEVASLLLFAWWIFGLEWPRIVAFDLGLRGWFLIDELMVLAPFMATQLVLWVALYKAERWARGFQRAHTLRRHLWMRGRQALGVMLPLLIVFSVGRDGLRWLFPRAGDDTVPHLLGLGVVGLLMLMLAPFFVRLSWPTRSLEQGELRDRLERLADRYGFKCTDILVWNTGGAVVNAGITGALPWFRYVLLTDALVTQLEPRQIEAVFGHELGHVAHRHLAFFGFFFLGSFGVLALLEAGLGWGGDVTSRLLAVSAESELITGAKWFLALGTLGVYFLLVFGHLSRRFERQADVFGCRAVSCGRAACPPHADVNALNGTREAVSSLCPVSIEIFADALRSVAQLNGLNEKARSWRHGSVARRMEFLRGLSERPEGLATFEKRIKRLRIALGVVLTAATGLALWLGGGGP